MLAAPIALVLLAQTPNLAQAAGVPSAGLTLPGLTVPGLTPLSSVGARVLPVMGTTNRIDGLRIEELDDGTTVLHVDGSVKPTFNVYRLGDPDRLVVDLAGAVRGDVVPHVALDTWACGRVSVDPVSERNAELVRVVIELKREVSYVVVPNNGELVITVTPRQVAPEAYFARKDAGTRQQELVAKEQQVRRAERSALALGAEAKVLNSEARKRAQTAKQQAQDAQARAKQAEAAETKALQAEARALVAEEAAGTALAEAKGQRFKARRVLKQAQIEREAAEQARAEAQTERKQAESSRNTANAKLAAAKAELQAEKVKLVAARERAEKAEAQAHQAQGRAEAAEKQALSVRGQAEVERKAAQAAKTRATKAERAAKAAQSEAETQLASARAELARAKASASRAEADAKSKLAKAERAAAQAAKTAASADTEATRKLDAAAVKAAQELRKAQAKSEANEALAQAKLAAAEKAEQQAQQTLTDARIEAKVQAAQLLAQAHSELKAAEADGNRTRAQAKADAEQLATDVRKQATAEAAQLAATARLEAQAEAAKLLADAGAKRDSATKLEAKAKAALTRAESAVAEAERERTAAAAARRHTDAELQAAKDEAKHAKSADKARAQKALAEAQSAARAAQARQKQTEGALARLQTDRNELKDKLAEQKKLSDDLARTIASRKSELTRLEAKVAEAKKAAGVVAVQQDGKLAAAQRELSQVKVTATVLEKEVDRLRGDATAADERARSAEAKVAALREAGAAQTKLSAAKTEARAAKTQAQQAAVLLAKRTQKLDDVERTLTDKRSEVKRLEAKNDALALQHAKLTKDNQVAVRELSASEAELAELRASLQAERSELRAVTQEVEQARATLDGRLAKAAEVEATKARVQAEADALAAAVAQAQVDKRRVQAEAKSLTAAAADAEAKKTRALAETETLTAAAAQAEATKNQALAEAKALAESTALAKQKAAAPVTAQAAKPSMGAATPTRIKDVRFEHDESEQRVVVTVEGPMHFEGSSLTPTIKMLSFDNAAIAKKLERSLDASSYAGVIKSITSFAEGDATKVLVSTVGPSKARVEERAGELVWHFPTPAGGLAPAPTTDVVSMAGSKVAGYATGPNPPLAAIPTSRMAAFAPPGGAAFDDQADVQPVSRRRTRWRGERIDIELQDAPIKDVLLLFSDIGRVNIIAGRGVDGSVTMKLNAVPWDQALDIILRSLQLGSNREGNVIRVATVVDLEAERQAAVDRANARVQLKPLETRLMPVSYATVEEMVSKVQSVLSPRGTVTPDQRTNTLIIMDVSDNIALAEQLVSSLDTQTPQVLIEARIVEARTNFTRNLGIQWGFDFTASPGTGNPTGLLFPNSLGIGGGGAGQPADVRGLILPGAAANPNYAVDLPAPVGTGQGGAIGFSFGSITGNLNTNLRLSAAESTGEVRIISAPKVVTLDNSEARIETGVQIPISQVSAQGVNTRFVNATLALRVTPQVTNEGAVLLLVDVQKNEADFVNTGARGDPTILTSQAHSRLLINDADTAVIGGIYTRNKAVNFTKIPWLADIPIIGWFFKNKTEADTRSEILIFLTPKIVNRASSIGG